MNLFTQTVLVVGRITTSGVQMLGTGFLISNDGKIATTKHVINGDERNLVILSPKINDLNLYQDTIDNNCQPISVTVLEIDSFRDIAILKAEITYNGQLSILGSFDDISVGSGLSIFGFPHCTEGRRVLTLQQAELGAKILLECNSIKSKHGVVNVQSRPGQSGSMVYAQSINKIVGMLIGAFVPDNGGGISLGGINPRELHQTTHCVSVEYIQKMLR